MFNRDQVTEILKYNRPILRTALQSDLTTLESWESEWLIA